MQLGSKKFIESLSKNLGKMSEFVVLLYWDWTVIDNPEEMGRLIRWSLSFTPFADDFK